MQLEGLGRAHVFWFVAWTFVLMGIISSPAPYTLNWAFASEIANRIKQGGEIAVDKSGDWAESTDAWSRQRWEAKGKDKERRICYDSSTGQVCK